MAITGVAAGDLAYEAARRVLDEHERTVLSGADRDAFLAAVLNPPEPTDRLVRALKRHRELFGRRMLPPRRAGRATQRRATR